MILNSCDMDVGTIVELCDDEVEDICHGHYFIGLVILSCDGWIEVLWNDGEIFSYKVDEAKRFLSVVQC